MEQRRFVFLCSVTLLFLFSITFLFSGSLLAQVHVLPTEKVESTAITTFSDETAAWPAQTYDSELIQTSNLSVFETLNRVPGIETRGSLSKGSPAITLRGSTKASRTLLLYDGIPLNLSDGIGAQEFLIPRETLGNVQTLKGPAGLYFGAHAMAGGINFLPEFYSRSRVRGTYGSFGQKGLFGAASLMNDDRNQLQITGFNESIDGDYSYYSPVSGGKGTRTRTDTHTQRGTLSGNHIFSGYKIGYRVLQAKEFGSSPGPISSPDPTLSRKAGSLYALKATKSYGPRWEAKAHASNLQTKSYFLTENTRSIYDSQAAQTTTGFVASYNEGADLLLQLLGDYKESTLKTSLTQNAEKRDQQFEPGVLAAFPFSEDMILQTGIRYLPTYGVMTKALGVVQSNENKKFWVTYSEGFRAPSLSDKHDQYATFQGNPNLKPEQSNQIEIGASQIGDRNANYFVTHVNYEVALFSTSYDNLIVTTSDFKSLKNSDFVRAYGGELSMSYPFALWSLGLGYSYLDTNSNGLPLAYSTEQKVQTSVAHYFGPLIFELQSSSWINYRRTASHQDKKSWNVFDFKIRTHGFSDWIFAGGVYNMFDEPIEYITGYPEPRKRATVSVERIF